MSCFKAKMHQIRFAAGAPPQTPLGELTAHARSLAGYKGAFFYKGRKDGKEGQWRGRDLLLRRRQGGRKGVSGFV